MIDAFRLAAFGAAALAMAGAFFGVAMARWLWADDLKHAQEIDQIRSRTEASLQHRIDAQSGTIDTQQKIIDLLRHRLGEQ